jgi:L,D-transpeptidase ErfK/SrfK
MMIKQSVFALMLVLLTPLAQALTYTIQPNSDLVGEVQSYAVKKGDTLPSIARQYDLGLWELQQANPNVNPNKKLTEGTQLVIPTAFILPDGARDGIILNLAELRLYYFPPNTNTVVTFPVGIGRNGWRTPTGNTTIVLKRANPVWVPTDSIRAEAENNGYSLPDAVPAGPNNPLGKYAINFAWSGIRMHGTTNPASIGTRASHGCIRLYPEDIESMFNQVELGTKVAVIYTPLKVGVDNGQLYLEAHKLFDDQEQYKVQESADEMLAEEVAETNYRAPQNVDWSEAQKLLNSNYGYPVLITNIH